HRRVVFGIVSIALLMASIDQTIVATALNAIRGDLHAELNWSGWTITIYALGQIIVMPLAGRLGEQFGRERDRAIGMFTSIFPIGGILGPIIGSIIVTYWSWREIFIVNVPIGI